MIHVSSLIGLFSYKHTEHVLSTNQNETKKNYKKEFKGLLKRQSFETRYTYLTDPVTRACDDDDDDGLYVNTEKREENFFDNKTY